MEIIDQQAMKFSDLDAVAVSGGPGSYTGLRIGATCAKGICYSLRVPLIAVPTMDIYLETLKGKFKGPHNLCPMMDARRMEVYTKMVNEKNEVLWNLQAKILDQQSFKGIEAITYIFGNGMPKFREIVHQDNLIFIEDIVPNAQNMGSLAYHKFKSHDLEDVAYFEPNYLKEWRTTTPKKQFL